MGQAEIIIDLIQHQLLPEARLVFAQRGDATTDRRHMLADSEIEAFNEGGVDLPAAGRQHVLDPLERAEDHAVLHLYQTAPPYGLDDLGIEEPGQGHPTGLGSCPCGLTAGGLYPLPIANPATTSFVIPLKLCSLTPIL